jgi:acetolactate synthase regulatory subunit
MLPADFTAVLDARDREEFREAVVRFTQHMGFETVSAMHAPDNSRPMSPSSVEAWVAARRH